MRNLRKPSNLTQRGAIAVEFAVLLVPLLMIAFGIAEFGRAIYQYNTLAKATRDAARFLTTRSPGDAAAHTAAKNMVVYGSATVTSRALLPGLTTTMVSICDSVVATACPGEAHTAVITGAGAINLVTVNVGGVNAIPYVFNFLTPYVSATPSINFGRIHVTMQQII
jgi:Flp pilus assembly protein TadG